MRPQKIDDQEMLEGLTKVFRNKGYEGASLKELAEVTGLKKASLYHRFPNGKKEMGEAVFNHLGNWVNEHVFKTLNDNSIKPLSRLNGALAAIRVLYDDGKETCILRAFSMHNGLELFEDLIKKNMSIWIDNFEKLGLAFDLKPEIARTYALQSLVEIQGSLIVTKGLNDLSIFDTTINDIQRRYLSE
ncbi:TetR/AcrR family transcriptional regulator [Nonlabens sp.]|uniref:TetR/AcrR family transcriptional regulator n=1 Tax=Nonlabens sp. TaxID=1888209 RepID=UPI003263C244